MLACKKEHGTAFVRIGTTGRGIVPHYRVEPELTKEHIKEMDKAFKHYVAEEKEDAWKMILPTQFVAYHGSNHKRLDWGIRELQPVHWSMGRMSYEDVQNLLGELRGFKRKKS